MNSNAFDLLLIDFDGTLCATQPAIEHCMRATLAAVTGVEPPEHAIRAVIGRGIGLEDSFTELAGGAGALDPALMPVLVRAYRERYAAEGPALTTMFPGWLETLGSIAAAGTRTAVVSNKGVAAVQAALTRFGLTDLIAMVIGDAPGVPKKPAPALFTDVIRPAFPAVAHDRVLVVGDTDADIRFARNAGISSCWARYGYGDADACAALVPDFIVASPAELESIVVRAHPIRG